MTLLDKIEIWRQDNLPVGSEASSDLCNLIMDLHDDMPDPSDNEVAGYWLLGLVWDKSSLVEHRDAIKSFVDAAA
jgi:hypothetical protein